ncbi:MAG: hypothetical protein ABIQ95_13085 [Bdellovibrionia bacterium]
MIQMNSLSQGIMLLLLSSLAVGFPNVLAAEDEHKTGESESKEGHKSPEPKAEKALSRPKSTSSHGAARVNGSNDLTPGNNCIVDHVVLDDLKRAKEELDERKKDIAIKESDLKTREKVIADELQQLEKIRDDIAHTNDQKAKEKEARVTKLVDTFLTMSPKSAAKVLAGLDDSLAVLAISQMDTLRLAKIMNNMDPKRSSKLSELLAGVKGHKERVVAKKGGG